MDLSPQELSLSQVNQQLHEYEQFITTDLFTAFCQDFDKMAAASVASMVDDIVTDVGTFLNREQIIGEARIQRTARNWFADVYDELTQRRKQLMDEQKLTEEQDNGRE
jgi:hypothetical protein